MNQTYNLQLKRDETIPNTWNLMGDLLGEDFQTSVTVQDGGLLIEVIDVNGSRHTLKQSFDFFTNKNNIEEILLNWKHNITKEEKGQAAAYLNEFFSEWAWNEAIIREVKLDLGAFYKDEEFLPDSFYNELSKGTLIIHPSGDTRLWRYDPKEGIWKDDGELIVHNALSLAFGDAFKRNYLTEAVSYIQGKAMRDVRFNERLNLICVENGILDLNTGELVNFSPDFYLTVKIPVKYDPSAKCPKIEKFLSEVLMGQEAHIKGIEEMFGYCVYRDYTIHKSFLLVGEGANGKSTLLNLFKAFLGEKNVASIALQNLTENRFAKTELLGKLSNIYADLPSRAIQQSGIFKMLTGNDSLSFERKFGGFVTTKSFAKLLFSCNEVPDVKEDTHAFFRRWVIISFNRKFGKDANRNILAELTTSEELSGLLNLAVRGLKRLMENGDFTNAEETEVVRDKYIRMASPVQAFVEDHLMSDPTGSITKDELYQHFVEYCNEKGYPTMANNAFARKLKEKFQPLGEEKKMIELIRKWCWTGVKYHENE